MKVKVKGLVFAGFAAAVFAQSAMATTPTDADMKTVTSKAYVDSKFDFTNGQVIMQGDGRGVTAAKNVVTVGVDDPLTTNDNENEMVEANDDALPTVSAVRQYVDNAVSSGVDGLSASVETNSASYLNFTETNGAFEVGLDNVPVTTAAGLTGFNSTSGLGAALSTGTGALVTAGAVNALIDTEGTAGTSTLGSGSTNATVPTSRNVYDFVTSQVGSAAYQPVVQSTDALQIGYKPTSGTATWKTLQGASSGNGAATNYVTIKEGVDANNNNAPTGVYTVNLDAAQIADSIATDGSAKLATENAVYDLVDREGTAGTSTIGNQSTTLVPTSKNVYDFVNNGYQAKATGQNVQIGYNGTWHTLSGDSAYITVSDAGSGATVALNNVADTTTDAQSNVVSTIANGATGTDLPTVANVQTYVAEQLAALPMNAAANNLPDGCQDGTHYCALVAHAATTGGTITYEWTVMAPTSSN